ncbi:hypothetical protein FHR71_005526 [Methylobacterium sp. RAS18]|nr:hypothetical protein [Methylobacterium sp. RAS18]
MAWLKRKIVSWLLPEIQAQQEPAMKAMIAGALHEHDKGASARMQAHLRRYG